MTWTPETYLTDGKRHAVIVGSHNACCVWRFGRWTRRPELPGGKWRVAKLEEIPAPMPGCKLPEPTPAPQPEPEPEAKAKPKAKRKGKGKGKAKA